MKRRTFLSQLSCVLLYPFFYQTPNIVLILVDDLGYGGLGCYGNPFIKTPHIDQLANRGVRFTQAYAPAPVCSPTRWSLMTGKHVGHCKSAINGQTDLETSDFTIAEALKGKGYNTACIGKWGLSEYTQVSPRAKGFDYFFGYMTHREAWECYPSYLWENENKIAHNPQTYAPDTLTEKAIEWVSSISNPFFLYFPLNLPHANGNLSLPDAFQVPASYNPYENMPWSQTEKNYASAHGYMDDLIGKLLSVLPSNTLIIFASDNGPDDYFDYPLLGTAGNLKGEKNTLYEAGIRVPLIVSGPGIDQGIETKPAWLVNFWKVALSNNINGFFESEMYWVHWYPKRGISEAVRLGDWKGIKTGDKFELYNIAKDETETQNLAEFFPEIVFRMQLIMNQYYPEPKVQRTLFPIIGG